MISVQEAQALTLGNCPAPQLTEVAIDDLRRSVLMETLRADRDYPPFDRVAMDGIGIAFAAFSSGDRRFRIEGCQRAGSAALTLNDPLACIEVMTGAPLPHGCDTVIRYEDTTIVDGVASIPGDLKVRQAQNIHQRASDYSKDKILLESGTRFNATHWSVAASIGAAKIQVGKKPRIAIISTGDELVDVGTTPLDHQIRKSNSYALLSSLREADFPDVDTLHLPDQMDRVMETLGETIAHYDVVILSGGVSKGKFDYIPKALADLKVEKVFHGVKQKPGKPIWFGVSQSKTPIFGLPGNPVSALVCFHRYVLPLLNQMEGEIAAPSIVRAILDQRVEFSKSLTYFLTVKLSFAANGTLVATPVRSNGSGDFSSLTRSSGFIELPENENVFEEGQSFPVFMWKEWL